MIAITSLERLILACHKLTKQFFSVNFSVSVHDIDQNGPSVKDLQFCEKIFSLVERERDGRKSPWDMTVGVLYKQQVAYGT